MKAYIAGPIFNNDQLAVIDTIIETIPETWNTFSPYHASREVWKGRAPKDCSPEERLLVLRQNYENIADSDVMISWLNGRFDDGRTDTGVSWEMGFAYACAYADHSPYPAQIGFIHRGFALPKDLNLMLAGTLDCLVDEYDKIRQALVMIQKDNLEVTRIKFNPDRFNLHESTVTGQLEMNEPLPDSSALPWGNRHVPGNTAHGYQGRSAHTSDPH